MFNILKSLDPQILEFQDRRTSVSPHVEVFFADVQAERPSAQHGDVADFALYPNVLAFARHAETFRQHGNLASAVIHPVELEREQRDTPRVGDDAVDCDRAVLVSSWVLLQVRDMCTAQRQGARRRHSDERDGEDSRQLPLHIGPHKWPRRIGEY